MVYLDSDKQTYADLSVVDRENGQRSLDSLFSNTETKKGKHLMTHWIMNPLSDLEAIRARQEAITCDDLPELPLLEEELDFIEYYLNYREQLRTFHPLLSVGSFIDRVFKHDSYRYIICRGVSLVVHMLYQLDKMRKEFPSEAPELMREFAEVIRESIYETELKTILQQLPDQEAKLSFYSIDKFDYLFRSTNFLVIQNLLSYIYQLDVCRTAHKIAKQRNYCCRPLMTRTMDFSIHGFVHPFIKKAVANDWEMDPGNICIVTGSNMAGKSTSLKALTLSVWLAHCGLPVPAREMVCPLFGGIYTSINLPDSLRDGRSHFLAEILRIKDVLQSAANGKRCLVVLDEMFRGTNAQDAFEASVAVNELLKKFLNSHFLISTHILEYAKSFEKDPSCCFYFMDSELKDDQLSCTYRLFKGVSETRVGYWMVNKYINIPKIQSANTIRALSE